MKKFNQKNINRIVFQKLFENEETAPPIPELGVMLGDEAPTESAYEWIFRHLPKPAREAIEGWQQVYERQRGVWWERFQEEWLQEHGQDADPFGHRMRKEFNELWKKMKEEYVRIKTTNPRGDGLPGSIDGKISEIFYKHFGFDLFDDDAGPNDNGPVFELG